MIRVIYRSFSLGLYINACMATFKQRKATYFGHYFYDKLLYGHLITTNAMLHCHPEQNHSLPYIYRHILKY